MSAHLDNSVERTRYRRERGPLRNVADVTGHVTLQISCGLDDIGRADHPAHAPAGHGEGLGDAIEDQAAVGDLRYDDGHRVMLIIAVDQVLVDLVGHDPDLVLDGPLADRLDLIAGIDRARRVRRRNKQQRLRLVGANSLELIDRDLPARIDRGQHGHRGRPGQADRFGVCGPVRGGDDHFVARVEQHRESVRHGVLAAVGDQHVGRFTLEAEVSAGLLGNRFTQHRQACSWRVLVVDGIVACGDRSLDDVRGSREVWFAGAKANDWLASSLQCLRLRSDGQSRRLLNCANPIRNASTH